MLFPTNSTDARWSELRKLVNTISGEVPDHPEIAWHEGVGIRLDWAGDRLWMLVEPRTVMVGIDDSNRAAATDFSRERTVRRYNKQLNDLISFWTSYLAAGGTEVRALEVSTGVDAAFKLGIGTAFSRRIR